MHRARAFRNGGVAAALLAAMSVPHSLAWSQHLAPEIDTRLAFAEPATARTADGSWLVVGNTYKAQVTRDGFTYIPRFAPDAPRNFPICFDLRSIAVGDTPLPLHRAQTPTLHADRIELSRGWLTENWHIAADSIEHTLTIERSPTNVTGDVVLRMNVTTELVGINLGDGLRFGNEHGSVTYSQAVLIDARQVHTPLTTTLTDGATITITIPARVLESAAWPITIDPVVQTNTIDGGPSNRVCDAAYDVTSDTWLVVWESQVSATDGDVLARRTNAQGAPIGSVIAIDASTENWRNPRVANNDKNNNYLVAAERGAVGSRDIWGRVVSAADGSTGSTFQISDAAQSGEKVNPDLGGDPFTGALPVHWLVVWERVNSAADHDIHARLVTPSSSTAAAPEGNTILVDNSTNTLDINPSISAGNRGFAWALAWQRDMANDDIMGARVLFDGTILHSTFPIDNTAADTQHPSVATPFVTQRYVVVYENGPTKQADIHARVLDDGDVLAEGNLTLIENVAPERARRRPSVDADTSQFVVACEQDGAAAGQVDVFVSTYCWDGFDFTVAEPHRRVAGGGAANARPSVAGQSASSGGVGFVVSWTQQQAATGLGSVHNARYNPGTCCPSDTNDSGATDVDDLVAVILAWGVCDTCPADVNGDSLVNVDDLVAVILGWGVCT